MKVIVILALIGLGVFSVGLLLGFIHIGGTVPGVLVLFVALAMFFWAARPVRPWWEMTDAERWAALKRRQN